MKAVSSIFSKLLSSPLRRWYVPVGAMSLAFVVISCTTVKRSIFAPPQIAGATYAGSKSCAECHETITRKFLTADHALLMAPGKNSQEVGCESCHGPASLHVKSGGEANTIINSRKDPETCFACHLDKRGQFSLANSHPLLAGKVSCSDCHNPHEGPGFSGSKPLLNRDETCTKCHTTQRGPFAFEHEAMRDGCTTCHNPHGTVNAKMLNTRDSQVCLQCHVQSSNRSIIIGGMPHSSLMRTGTCWTAGCHEAVHGSHNNANLRY
jgi:predicted CXXCH cytochrome family protein